MHCQFRAYIENQSTNFALSARSFSSTVVRIEVVNKFISNTLYILMEKNFVSSNNNEISFLF